MQLTAACMTDVPPPCPGASLPLLARPTALRVACFWWLISEYGGDGTTLSLPSWSAQFELLADNSQFDPALASDWQRYLLSLYMAWSGISALGYGTLVITKMNELAFAILICIVQIVRAVSGRAHAALQRSSRWLGRVV